MAILFEPSLTRVVDSNGIPISGAELYVYLTETTTPQTIYAAADEMSNLTNPVVADATGLFDPVFLDADIVYRVVLKTDVGATIWDADPVHVIDPDTIGGTGGEDPVEQGTHTIPVLANNLVPNTTNGASRATTESTTNKVMLSLLDFDKDTDESAQITIPMPKSWNEGTITVQFIWTATSTGSVVWGCSARAFSDDDAIDTAFGTAQTVTDAVTASGDVMESSFTSAITIAGSPAAEDIVVFKFYRDADNVSDTLAVDARLIGVRIKYTINAATDA